MRPKLRAVVLASVLLAACARSPSSVSGSTPTLPSGSSASPATSSAGSGFSAGKAYPYRFTLTTALSLNENTVFDFDLSGSLRVLPVSVSGSHASLYLTVDGAKAVSRLPSGQAQLDQVAQQVESSGCFVDFEDGKVRTLHLPSGMPAMPANLYRELAAELQFAVSSSARYTAEEYDTTGQYEAEYTPLPGARHFSKKKLRYVGMLGAQVANAMLPSAPVQAAPQVVSSEGDVTLSAAGRPLVIHSKNQVLFSGAQVPVGSTTVVSLEADVEQALPAPSPDFSAILAKTIAVAANEPFGGQAAIDSLDDARIHGETFDTLYASLSAAPAVTAPGAEVSDDKRTVDAKAHVFIALGALFRRQPPTVELALSKIRKNAPGAAELLDALGSASSPAAQDALLALARDNALEPKLQTRVLRSLARTQRPTPGAVAAFEGLLVKNPFDAVGLYGLGTYSRRLRDAGDLLRANAIGDALLRRLHTATNEPDLIVVIEALSNAGYAQSFASLQRYVSNPSEPVRVAAVRALQSIKDPQVDRVLATAVTSDTSSEVRISAINAAQVRAPSDPLATALTAAALEASDPHVRFRAVELMGQWLPRWPSFRSTLEGVASKDSEGKVRDRAKAAL